MELLLGIESGEAGVCEDVSVTVAASHTGGDLATAVAAHCGLPPSDRLSVRRGDHYEALDLEATVADLGLVAGDVICLGCAARRPDTSEDRSSLRLAVSFGPDAGASHDLTVGTHAVGRAVPSSIIINDPQLSRHQLTVTATESGAVTISPGTDVVNPTRINGETLDGETPLLIGDIVQMGASSLILRRSKPAADRSVDFFGGVPFHRTPYFRHPVAEQSFTALKDLPERPEPRRFQYLAALMPVLMGVSMAFMMGNMRFLLFAFMSPAMVAGNWFDQRKTSGIKYNESIEVFEQRFAERQDELANAVVTEREARHRNGPDVELLANRAENRHSELWLRDRETDDFLSLRIGVGTVASRISAKVAERGDRTYRDRVDSLIEATSRIADVPVHLDLMKAGTAGLVGANEDTGALTAALLVQASCLHSPEDLVIMAAVPHDTELSEWLKWVPHARSSSSPLGGDHLVGEPDTADRLLREVAKIAEQRAGEKDTQIDRRWPWILLVIDRALEPDAGVISRLLDAGPNAGVSVVWLTTSAARVPRQANAVVRCQSLYDGELSSVHYTDPEIADQYFDLERVGTANAENIGRWLAPMRDASAANAATSIPRMVPLFGSLDVEEMTPAWIAEQWCTDRGYALTAPIGMTETGPLILDLVEHGPHGLIGGTSGAGKSELVQSLVVNLMAYNSPERINFLFVDYKGGALSELFKDVPHSVGAVTNLDALLALRALTSLTAELDRRMELFKGRATDIRDMLRKFPDEAPPSLVIVVDEFAALVRELPEFVDGIVSIAERGRSLGIHLLMSTQRPSGAINDNIQQNTNLRIALRMLDGGESRNVIGSADAALIPGPLKGRGFARLGPGELVAFQSAWSGAPLTHTTGPAPVGIKSFTTNPQLKRTAVTSDAAPAVKSEGEPLTQLDVTIAAIIDAAQQLGHGPGRPPWREVLPSQIDLRHVLNDPRSAAKDRVGRSITFGMIDDPAAQDQYPATIDLEADGALAIFGNGGSGKTTLLRTLAVSAAVRDSAVGGGGLSIFGLDFASRELGLISRLPQCGAVAMGDDLETVTRILSMLDTQLARRRAAMAAAATRGDEAPSYSCIMLVIDGYENLVSAFESTSTPGMKLHQWGEVVTRLITDGRQVGIHTVFTASRRGAVRANVMSAVSNRIVLRQSEDTGYMELGIPSKMAKGLELEPGQGFVHGSQMVQIASLLQPNIDGGLDDRSATIELAESLKGSVIPEICSELLPEEIGPLTTGETGGRTVRIGIADMSLQAAEVDLSYNNMVVAGGPRTGRSTALRVIGEQLAERGEEVWVFGTQSSPLRAFSAATKSAFGRVADVTPVLEDMATLVESYPDVARVLLFDDVDLIDDRSMYEPLQKLVEAGVRCIGSVTSLKGFGQNPLYAELKTARIALVLQPEHSRDVQEITGVAADLRPGVRMTSGRGVLVSERNPTLIQVCSYDVAPSSIPLVGPTDDLTPMPPDQDLTQTISPVAIAPSSISPSAISPSPISHATVPQMSEASSHPTLALALESGERITMDEPTLVGRKPRGNIDARPLVIQDELVSSTHLRVRPCASGLELLDEHSLNGTTLHGPDHVHHQMVAGQAELVGPGTRIEIGLTTLTVVPISREADPNPPL